ncbi:DNA repair protein RAD16, partial [Exophiala xenobiotica]
ISELKKANPGLEMDDWTPDSALHQNFDAIVRRQLDPVWHRVSWRTKQIANDLTVLRSILHSLLSYDSVSLLKYLDTVHATHSPPPGSTRHDQSPWLFSDAASTIFQSAKNRVYNGKAEDTGALPTSKLPDSLSPVLEEQPKWAVLAEILQEIEVDAYLNPTLRDDSNDTILIMCNDQRACRQVKEYLQTMHVKPLPQDMNEGQAPHEIEAEEQRGSAEFMMRRKLREYLGWKKTFAQVSASLFEENQKSLNDIKGNTAAARLNSKAPANKRRRLRGGGGAGMGPSRTAHGAVMIEDKAAQVASLLAELRPTESEALQKEEIIVDDLRDAGEDFFELYEPDDQIVVHPYDGDQDDQLLEEIRPRYIIMYSPATDFIRRVEVYRSSHSDRSVRAYFMYYGGSIEEQRYLSAFRSALPSLLHGRSMITVPCQLTVGDYVLSPHICVERKSIRDLIASFKNGRLFNQAETMLQHYKYPFLLIEFDANKSFTLDPFADLTSISTLKTPDSDTKDLQSKLVLLTLAFPRLKVIWSSSPYQTAEIFEELKKQQEEPDPLKAVQIGLAEGEDPDERTFNTGPQELLRTIPGVTAKNASRLYLETKNVLEVANMSLDELDPMVGRESGRQI